MKRTSALPETATYRRRQAAARIGCGLWALDRLLASGQLQFVRAGDADNSAVLILQSSVDAFLSGQRVAQ